MTSTVGIIDVFNKGRLGLMRIIVAVMTVSVRGGGELYNLP